MCHLLKYSAFYLKDLPEIRPNVCLFKYVEKSQHFH